MLEQKSNEKNQTTIKTQPTEKAAVKPQVSHPDQAAEPSLDLNIEEIMLIKDGIELLPQDRKKTVVFDRLMMKIARTESYWKKIESIRAMKLQKVAEAIKTKKPEKR